MHFLRPSLSDILRPWLRMISSRRPAYSVEVWWKIASSRYSLDLLQGSHQERGAVRNGTETPVMQRDAGRMQLQSIYTLHESLINSSACACASISVFVYYIP